MSDSQKIHFFDKTRAAYSSGDKSAAKRLANMRWYQANKDKKQKYNKDYYQQHKEYWQQFYVAEQRQAKQRQQWADEAKEKAAAAKKKYGENSKEYKRAKLTSDLQADSVKGHEAEAAAAKINIQRAQQELDNHMKHVSEMKIKNLWKSGAKQISDAGKKAVATIMSKFRNVFG